MELHESAPGVWQLTWQDPTAARTADLRMLIEGAFAEGAHRVEAEVSVDDRDTRRALQRAGLRPEGVARGRVLSVDGQPLDVTRLARLATDPEPGTRESFLAMLNATLPRTRTIAQGLVRDDQGRVLLCELTYKKDWDLPGGVVDPHESPRAALAREVAEELGLDLPIGPLLAVNWLPPYRQWDDAILFVFDLGVVPNLVDLARLETSELAGVHWVPAGEVPQRLAPYAARHLQTILARESTEGVLELEDGTRVARDVP